LDIRWFTILDGMMIEMIFREDISQDFPIHIVRNGMILQIENRRGDVIQGGIRYL
jgi:hypothetical protein